MSASLYAALAVAQSEMKNPVKNATNPAFRSKYANLDAVVEATMPILNKHGLSLSVWPAGIEEGRLLCRTRLAHAEGGEIIEESAWPVTKNDPQGVGSALTYARRYIISAICGVAPDDDDDGAQASAKPAPATAPQPAPAKAVAPIISDDAKEIEKLQGQALVLIKASGRDWKDIHETYSDTLKPLAGKKRAEYTKSDWQFFVDKLAELFPPQAQAA